MGSLVTLVIILACFSSIECVQFVFSGKSRTVSDVAASRGNCFFPNSSILFTDWGMYLQSSNSSTMLNLRFWLDDGIWVCNGTYGRYPVQDAVFTAVSTTANWYNHSAGVFVPKGRCFCLFATWNTNTTAFFNFFPNGVANVPFGISTYNLLTYDYLPANLLVHQVSALRYYQFFSYQQINDTTLSIGSTAAFSTSAPTSRGNCYTTNSSIMVTGWGMYLQSTTASPTLSLRFWLGNGLCSSAAGNHIGQGATFVSAPTTDNWYNHSITVSVPSGRCFCLYGTWNTSTKYYFDLTSGTVNVPFGVSDYNVASNDFLPSIPTMSSSDNARYYQYMSYQIVPETTGQTSAQSTTAQIPTQSQASTSTPTTAASGSTTTAQGTTASITTVSLVTTSPMASTTAGREVSTGLHLTVNVLLVIAIYCFF